MQASAPACCARAASGQAAAEERDELAPSHLAPPKMSLCVALGGYHAPTWRSVTCFTLKRADDRGPSRCKSMSALMSAFGGKADVFATFAKRRD